MTQRARRGPSDPAGAPQPVVASFRDPRGFVFRRNGRLLRQVNRSHAEDYDHLLGSGLYEALTEQGLLIRHEEVDIEEAATPDAYRLLAPEPVDFVSYPYEWCFGQLKDAALTTLRAQDVALNHGMSLRDASAYNLQFQRGRPVFIDTLSFGRLRPGQPWVAYRQFCQHFLGPLALMAYRDVRLGQLLRVHLDGTPLDLVASLLPRRSRLRPPLLLHVYLHAQSQRRHAGASGRRTSRTFSLRAFRGLVESLRSGVQRLNWNPSRSGWVGYYQEGESYTPGAAGHKRELVARFLDEVQPKEVWDLGGNVGDFSRMATVRGIRAVCFDVDPGCVEANYRQAVAGGETGILPLVMDLTNPSPRIGWENQERMSLADRGPADLVLALALVHHLAIGNNVPLERLAAYLWDLGRSLIAEFVPKSDPRVRDLLSVRDDIFEGYTDDGFQAAFSPWFDVVDRQPIRESQRILYLMRRRDIGRGATPAEARGPLMGQRKRR